MTSLSKVHEEVIELRKDFNDHIEDDKVRFLTIENKIDSVKQSTDEILEIIRALKLGKSFIVGASILIGSFIGVLMGLKQIALWFR